MVRTRDTDVVKSSMIIAEVKKRPCLFDTNDASYGDRAEKTRCWEEVCDSVLPGWSALTTTERLTAGKEVQKRWRSIRDSYTKMYRQGKCASAEQCAPGSRRYNYQRELAFLKHALMNKKPRYSQDKYEPYSEVSSSPLPPPLEESSPRIMLESSEKPLDSNANSEASETTEQNNQNSSIDNKGLQIKIASNSILPEDHFDDDRLFVNSLLPLFKKMDDDTRLHCRVEFLRVLRYSLQGKFFDALKTAKDSLFQDRMMMENGEDRKPDVRGDSKLNMTTRSADGSIPIRKRAIRSQSPLPTPPKKRGPGRPRKIRPPPSDSDEEPARKRCPKLKTTPVEVTPEVDDSVAKATSIEQLSTPDFMKAKVGWKKSLYAVYNLARSELAPALPATPALEDVKMEPTVSEPTTS